MNYENKNWSYSPFPWLEEKLKNYELNTDYKIEYINGFKHYTILSERLKKVMEEEWHAKFPCNHSTDNDFFSFKRPFEWWKEFEKYQEGVDYRIEKTVTESGLNDWKYIPLSEKMKQKFAEWKVGELDPGFEKFANWLFFLGSPDWQKKMKEENRKKRPKFIAENNPPQNRWTFPTAEDNAWNQQQPPLTSAELAVLNDPILEHHGDWEEAVRWIMRVRETNSCSFPDEKFKWGVFLHKDIKNPKSSMYKVNQAFKNAGISLDKWKERVAKGQKLEAKRSAEKPQKDKEKILANIQDWEIRGEYIYNPKTGHWKSGKNNMWTGGDERYSYYHEWDGVHLTPETYQEVRKVIFNNLLKIIHYDSEKQCLINKETSEVHNENHFSPTEWKEVIRLFNEKGVNLTSSQPKQPVSADYSKYYVVGGIMFGLVLIGATILLKIWRKRIKIKHDY